MSDLLGDARYVIRAWRRAPVAAAAIVLTLTLALALSAAVFSFADGYLFRPLPFPGADRVYLLRDPQATPALLKASDTAALKKTDLASLGFVEWSPSDHSIGEVDVEGRKLSLFAYDVSPGFRATLSLPLALGRDFAPEEHRESRELPGWISYRFWEREFGRDPAVIGKVMRGKGPTPIAITIVGVLGRDVSSFDLNNRMPDAVLPGVPPSQFTPNTLSNPMVRLPEGMSVDEAKARLEAALNAVAPAPAGKPARTVRLRSVLDAQQAGGKPTAKVLLAGALLVLLLATINVVQVLLTRSVARAHEVRIRAALGASRWRVARLFLTESVLLGALGVAGGLLLGGALSTWIASRVPEFPTGARNLALVPMAFDLRVVTVAIALGCVVALIGGVFPAWRMGRSPLASSSRTMSGVSAPVPSRFARTILAAQLIVATTVMVGTVSIGTGIWRYLYQPLGFDTAGRIRMEVLRTDGSRTVPGELTEVARILKQATGVRAAGVDTREAIGGLEVDGRAVDRGAATAVAVSDGYLAAWGSRLVSGRGFSEQEYRTDADIAIVDQKAARAFWPDADPLGRDLRVGGKTVRIVGVIEPWRSSLMREPTGLVLIPRARPAPAYFVITWAPGITAADLQARLAPAVASAVPGVTVKASPVSFESLFLREIGESIFQAPIVMTFGAMAFALAGVGVYGLVSFLSLQRRREYGVRLALGAKPASIWLRVVRESVLPAAIGLVGGILVARGLEKVVESSVFGWKSSGMLAIAVVGGALFAVAIAASAIPAVRAMRLNPVDLLKTE